MSNQLQRNVSVFFTAGWSSCRFIWVTRFAPTFPDIHWVIEEMRGEGEKVFSHSDFLDPGMEA
jgi:hypothetical protein